MRPAGRDPGWLCVWLNVSISEHRSSSLVELGLVAQREKYFNPLSAACLLQFLKIPPKHPAEVWEYLHSSTVPEPVNAADE